MRTKEEILKHARLIRDYGVMFSGLIGELVSLVEQRDEQAGPDYGDGPEFEGWAERSGQRPAKVQEMLSGCQYFNTYGKVITISTCPGAVVRIGGIMMSGGISYDVPERADFMFIANNQTQRAFFFYEDKFEPLVDKPKWLKNPEALAERLFNAGWRPAADAQHSGVRILFEELTRGQSKEV